MHRTKILIPVLLSASLLGLTSVEAREPSGQHTEIVSYADLNLNSPAGRAALDNRIERAVQNVCGTADPLSQWTRRGMNRCRAEARASAFSQRTQAIAVAQGGSIQLSSRQR